MLRGFLGKSSVIRQVGGKAKTGGQGPHQGLQGGA